ncbi:MAG: 1-acyl-sn-glycerol-3-phosphate acyltransferase [Candidatus Omnitrophica bacterium]|nr:1-acyl-sn-glycerol-3-phosphate acyltransferase [Candidatus Omnitrophota bacterium]
MLYLIVRSLAIGFFKVLFRLQVLGLENIPLKGGFILASNHASYLDPPALAAVCPRKLCFLAKEELFIGVLGRLIANLNAFPIKGQPGELVSLRRAIKELQAGRALAIFPEGRRTAGGRLGKPMPGVGLLAAKTGVCIVPAFIEGSNRALPIDSKFIRLKKIKVYFGKPLWPQAVSARLAGEDFYQALAARTMEEIGRLKPQANNEN